MTAFSKMLDKELKPLKSECDAEMLDEYMKSGNTQARSKIFGKKAWTYTVPIKDAVPPEEVADYALSDDEAFSEWLDANQDATIRYAMLNAQDFARFWFNFTGELPDGTTRVAYMTDGMPEMPGTPRLKVDADYMVGKMEEMGLLPEGMRLLLLGDGND